MKGKLYTAVLILVLVAGLAIMLYPVVSDAWNARLQSDAILEYADQVEQMEAERYREQWTAAERYNADLNRRADVFALTPELEERYNSLLSATDDGIIAYVEIPSVSVTLPIARGTEEKTLQKYVGHLEWSSLPVGGESTHCVLSGHRGLPSSELFTNIDRLVIGDRFYIHILGQTLEYEVDNIAVVEPHDFSLLGVTQGYDHATLITCTPYGINSHRLLVRGVRVEQTRTEEIPAPENDEFRLDPMILIPAARVLLVAVVAVALIADSRKQKRKGGKYEKK